MKFDFTILHEPGNSPIMCTADYLSRLESFSSEDLEGDSANFEDIPQTVFAFHTNLISDGDIVFSFDDRKLSDAEFDDLQMKCNSTKNQIEKFRRNPKSSYQMKDNLLYKGSQLVLPDDLSREFIQFLHCYTCHAGSKQLNMMVGKFFIFNVQEKTREITTDCLTCIYTKPLSKLRPSMIKTRHFKSTPFTKTFFDLMNFGHKDGSGKRYLLTCCDSLTGFIDGEPLGTKSDALVARSMLNLILRHGCSDIAFTDNGSEFGNLVAVVFRKFDIRHFKTTAYTASDTFNMWFGLLCDNQMALIKIWFQ